MSKYDEDRFNILKEHQSTETVTSFLSKFARSVKDINDYPEVVDWAENKQKAMQDSLYLIQEFIKVKNK
jgi:hypothetical protein